MSAPFTRRAQSGHFRRDAWYRLVLVSFSFALGASVGIGSLYTVAAQESSQGSTESERNQPVHENPDASAKSDRESSSDQKTQGPPREPRFLPAILRPKLTPEQLEEAERLRKLAAKYGTDPTAIVGRVQLSSQYLDLPHGAQLETTIARVDVPFRGNWLLRVDTPVHTWLDPNRPGLSSAQGMGDVSAVLGWRAYNTPEYAFLIGVASTFPTASDDLLGTGKYNVGPIIATGRFLSRLESFLFGVFQHSVSAGGDPDRADVSLSQLSLNINTIWVEKWWSTVQGVWRVDWERKTKSSMALEFELGRNILGRWGPICVQGSEFGETMSSELMIGISRSAPATCSNRFSRTLKRLPALFSRRLETPRTANSTRRLFACFGLAGQPF